MDMTTKGLIADPAQYILLHICIIFLIFDGYGAPGFVESEKNSFSSKT